MLSEDAAFVLLQPLAEPTNEAFKDAMAVTEQMRAVSGAARKEANGAMLATLDGVAFWSFFASQLQTNYAAVPGLSRVAMAHPLSSEWVLEGEVLLRLKADINAVDGSQLSLDVNVPSAGGEMIVLTYSHEGAVRFAPTFMQPLSKSHQAWTWSVSRLLEAPATPQPVKPHRPASKITSALPPAEQSNESSETSAPDVDQA